MANERKARVIYQEDYNGKEGLKVEIMTDGSSWDFESFFPLVAKDGATEIGHENERDFVHWRLLRKINELIQYGYQITKIDI